MHGVADQYRIMEEYSSIAGAPPVARPVVLELD
jgi:hypothetical protein